MPAPDLLTHKIQILLLRKLKYHQYQHLLYYRRLRICFYWFPSKCSCSSKSPPLRTISVSALPGVAPKLSEADTAIVPTLIFIAPVNDELFQIMLGFHFLA